MSPTRRGAWASRTCSTRHPYHLGRAQRKLVTIASVLAMRTPVLVLDEPTTAQDHRTSDSSAAWSASSATRGTAVVCISHDVRLLADVADRLVVLDAGRTIADDAPRAGVRRCRRSCAGPASGRRR